MIPGLIIYAVLVTICLVVALGGNNDLAIGRVVPMRRRSE